MGKYRAYSEYKDSGVEWLGEVPSHWDKKRIGFLFNRKKDTDHPEAELLSVYRDYGVIPKNSRDDNWNKPSEDLSPYQLVQVGDLVMNKMKTWQGSIAVSEYEGIVSPAYHVAEPDRSFADIANPRYLHYLLRSPIYISQYGRLSKGIRVNQWDLDYEVFKTIEALLPSVDEQSQISAFLDRETAKIDRLIAKQEALIALLKEKRQAVISHAVTKGLDPDAPMKDSGVEWLGEIPAHWEVKRLKHVAKLESGHTPDKKKLEYWTDCSIPWVSLNDSKELASKDYLNDTKFKINEQGLANSSARLLPARTVVFTRDASVGLTSIVTCETAVSQHLIAWVCNELMVVPEFLLLVLYAMGEELDRYTFGATIKTIGMGDVKKLVGAFPPVEEQVGTFKYVFSAKEKIDKAICLAVTWVDLLKERRTALISAAVTGKIDVREAV